MTEKQIEHGFWLRDKENNFPPDSIKSPADYAREINVNIACTQILDITPTEQKRLIKQWVEFLPGCDNIEMLWFTTQTTQEIFDSTCKLKNLIGLNIKWSNIKSLDQISNLKKLRYLRIGSSAKIASIEPLSKLTNLEVLVIENFKKITDLSPLSTLTNLKFLSIEGGMYTKQKVETFEPISKLTNLVYFSAAMISCADKRIEPILKLKNLITLNWAFELPKNDMARLKSELPKLKHLPGRYFEKNMEKIRSGFK